MCRNTYILIFILMLSANSVHAATYTYQATSFAWETASTNVVWDQTNTSYPRDDDKQTVNLGFNFTFGGVTYTQVRIITNGSLDFGADQSFHQVYTNTAMPAATVDRMIVPYWDDLNPDGGGTVRYSTLGVGPNRRFVVSWESVPVYPATGSYTFQAIIYENGDIKFQYGAGNANGSSATIGVEVDDSDYTQYSFNSNSVSNGTAILFTAPPAPAARAYYALEANSWSGAGSVIDSLGNFNGSPVDGVAPLLPPAPTPPGTCRAGNIPANTSTSVFDAVDTGIDVNTAIGNLGAIGFWYRATTANRNAAVDGPYLNVSVGVNPTDTDSVQTTGFDLDIDNNTVNDRKLVGTSSIRFGRLIMQNNFGSELLAITLPLLTEYYNSTQFITNTNDSCSAYSNTNISFTNRLGLTADPAKTGSGLLINGSYDPANPVTLNSSSQSGSIDATLTVPTWLQFDWDNNGTHDNNPASHINFGIFNGSNRQIYIREVY